MKQKEWVELGFLWWRALNSITAELLSWPKITNEHVKEAYGVTLQPPTGYTRESEKGE